MLTHQLIDWHFSVGVFVVNHDCLLGFHAHACVQPALYTSPVLSGVPVHFKKDVVDFDGVALTPNCVVFDRLGAYL